MTREDPRLIVNFEALGRRTSRIERYTLESDYLTSTDGFEFGLYDEPAFMEGLDMHPVELLISGPSVDAAQQLLGRIDVTELGGEGSGMVCRGRDYMADLVECHVDPELKIAKNTTLADAIKLAAAPVGITKVNADGDVGLRNIRTGKAIKNPAPKSFREIKLDELKPQPGLGIYEWGNRVAARNGVTLQPWNKRNELCLSAPDYEQAPSYEIRRSTDAKRGLANNVLDATAVRDFSSFPTHVLFTGKNYDPTSKAKGLRHALSIVKFMRDFGNEELLSIIPQHSLGDRRKPKDAGAIDGGKLYRLFYQQDSEATNSDQLYRVAVRAFAELFKNTLVYRVTLKGHEDPRTGALWTVNTIVDVRDEICRVNEPLWIASRSFTYDGDSGARTELECWRKEAFQV
jgi:hypothetical protein